MTGGTSPRRWNACRRSRPRAHGPRPGATFRFHDAGHILGAAYVEALVSGTRLVFSGDLGRYGTTLLCDPAPLGEADVIVCESTYGDRHHEPDADSAFHRILTAALARGGPIVLPAFAVERTQSLLVAIGMLQRKDPALATVPVHVDSPMAARVNDLFSRFPEAHKAIAGSSPEHFGCRNLRVHVTSAESKELNHLAGPAIIIASSGMANGGRVLYHLHRRLTDPDATIVFAGYQVEGTLGRSIIDGAKQVRIFGDRLAVPRISSISTDLALMRTNRSSCVGSRRERPSRASMPSTGNRRRHRPSVPSAFSLPGCSLTCCLVRTPRAARSSHLRALCVAWRSGSCRHG